ncbi:ABC transporter permease [Fictibacillus gelatini]|uniref:ABC transporter permease n=1 Tax=Fictibacillus gelatini TaxID=225985 RepID=UPI0004210A65|nr:ABC transporter permease subunit [Fictibacillus gelatini]
MIRSVKFWIGLSIILLLVTGSFIHTLFFDSYIRQQQIIYDNHHNVIGAAPFPPSLKFPLGTDKLGYDIGLKVLQGAKFTICFAVLIALLRVIISLFVAIPYAFYIRSSMRLWLEKLLSSFYYVPLTILAIFILTPILQNTVNGFLYSFPMRIILEVVILTVLVVPLISVMIGNMMAALMKEEFVEGAKVLGASKWRIFHKHLLPHLVPKMLIVFTQQCVQVLIIFIHLGYFKLFFGGSFIDFNQMAPDPPRSLSNEWSGLIGNYYIEIFTHPFVAIGPIIMFAIVIYAFNLITEGMQTHYSQNKQILKKGKKNKKATLQQQPTIEKTENKFTFIDQKGA